MKGGFVFCAAVLAVLTASGASGATMYARTSVKVRDGTSLSAGVIAELSQGDGVEVLAREGNHYRVAVGEDVGYIYHTKLMDTAPEDVAAVLARDPATRALRLDELETGGAMRGLSQTGLRYAESARIPQWARDAVDAMRAREVTAEELEDFARLGRLGEYGEGP